MILGLTGPKLGGKGTTAGHLEKTEGATVLTMSDVLVDIAERLHLPLSRSNLITIARALRSEFGEDILAKVLKQDIEAAGDDKLTVIDGIRMASELDLFSKLKDFHLLYIDAPLEERYRRVQERKEKEGESGLSFDEFKAEEDADTEKSIGSFKELAEQVVQNDSTKEALYNAVDAFVDALKKK